MIEKTFGRPTEMYSLSEIEELQRKINLFKEQIKYDDIVREVADDMKRLGLKK